MTHSLPAIFFYVDHIVVEVDRSNNPLELEIESIAQLVQFCEGCNICFRLVEFNGISIDDELMQFFRRVNRNCWRGTHLYFFNTDCSTNYFRELIGSIFYSQYLIIENMTPRTDISWIILLRRQFNLMRVKWLSFQLDNSRIGADAVATFLHSDYHPPEEFANMPTYNDFSPMLLARISPIISTINIVRQPGRIATVDITHLACGLQDFVQHFIDVFYNATRRSTYLLEIMHIRQQSEDVPNPILDTTFYNRLEETLKIWSYPNVNADVQSILTTTCMMRSSSIEESTP